MINDKRFLIKTAMVLGIPMGIYWCLKYIFLILGYSYPIFIPVYEILTLLVIVIAYYMTKMYIDIIEDLNLHINFFHAWQFGVALYFFSSLILSIEQFIYFQYLAPEDFFINLTNQASVLLKQINADPQLIESVKDLSLTPITMTIQGIFNNTFYGMIFSLPVAAILCRKK